MAIELFDKDVEIIQKLDDEPNDVQGLTPAELKKRFDQAAVWLKEYINSTLIPAITGDGVSGGGAANIGASVDDFSGSTVQDVLDAFNDALIARYTKAETDAYVGQKTNDLVSSVSVNLDTGVITVTKKDGTQDTFDTALEKVPASMALVEDADGTYLVITNQDGSTTRTNVSNLIDTYTFNNSTEIAFSTSGADNNRTVTATIRDNSIGMNKFTLEVTQSLEQYNSTSASNAQAAEKSADAAADSAAAALSSQTAAADSASTASTKAGEASRSAASASQSAGSASSSAQSAQSNAGQALSARNAAQSAQTAAESARDAAVTAKNGAVAARQAIENMQVAADTLSPGSSATVTKTTENGVVKLTYGIPRGEKGDTGMGLTIKGYYASLSALQSAVPSPAAGDAYGVGTGAPYDIYIWDGAQWVNNGPLQGGKGDPGADGGYYQPSLDSAGNLTFTASKDGMPAVAGANIRGPAGADGAPGQDGADGAPGAAGKSAYQAAVDAGYTGTEEEFNTALAGMQDGPFLPLSGGFVNGALGAKSVEIKGTDDPEDTAAFYASTDNVYMNVDLGMNYCKIVGLASPTGANDAANKGYVDSLVGNINSVLDAINGEVV